MAKWHIYFPSNQKFDEVGNIVDDYLKKSDLTDLSKAIVLHQLFGLACDVSESGEEYKIGGNPLCPKCGKNYNLAWEPTYPIEIVELAVKAVTHESWNKLTKEDKKNLIESAISPVLAQREKLGIV